MKPLWATVVLAVSIHVHHHFHGPPLDYTALTLGAFASWVGIPGPGEPLLIAAGVLAGQHKLDLAEVLLFAWLGATVGGIGGWLLGLKAGRRLLSWQGPLQGMRERMLERGDKVFARFPRTAVVLTPTWVSGIHRVGPALYLPWNAIGAAIWTCGIGIGAYLAGPPIVEVVGDTGLIGPILLGVALIAGLWLEIERRRRLRRRT